MAYDGYGGDFNDYLSNQFFGGSDTPLGNPNNPPPYVPVGSDGSTRITQPGGEQTPISIIDPPGRTARRGEAEIQDTGGGDGGGGSPAPSGGGGGAPNVPAPGNDANQIQGWYSKFLGRNASDAEIQSHLQNPGGLGAVMNLIANSPEAMAYAKSQGFGQPTPGNQGSSGGGGGGTGQNNGGFADPAYQALMDLVNKRLGQLQGPVSFPQLDALMKQLADQQAVTKQRAQTYADQLKGRVGELQKPLLTDANVVQQRALASNATLGQRDALLDRSRADLAARGIDPRTSGLAFDRENQIGQNYSNAQANIDAQLQQGNIQSDEKRRNLATTLQGLATQALQGGDLSALQNQSQMAEMENQLFNLNENRANQTLAVGQIPVDLTNMGFSNALNASNSQQNPLMALLSLASLGNSQQGLQQAGQNSNMSSLAWLMQMLFK